MSQAAGSGGRGPALPSLPDFAREHMEAGWENRALEQQLRQQRDYLVAFLGDSITAQLGDGHPLIARAQAALGGPVGVFGVPGDTVANLMWRLGNGGMPAAQAYVVQIGTNDVWMCERPERVMKQIQQLVGYLQGHHPAAHVVLLGLFYMMSGLMQPSRSTPRCGRG
ncbi:lipolytic G-D-S-L family [Chlorella sorokiniana]|uniref:Lipolytic G-D-S-L family n=1 Tax=Chlorella sorokiniana TaxID=3076 RepID=A0A2P6U353_CHLSO|nr:lipolytic G-D-S-L family [Chlorella sorokiniana]|eukprot:PRW60739.1 lipolytic G-D-S-L family [Chlorella sorokiniana]